jgi:hypothetical protein
MGVRTELGKWESGKGASGREYRRDCRRSSRVFFAHHARPDAASDEVADGLLGFSLQTMHVWTPLQTRLQTGFLGFICKPCMSRRHFKRGCKRASRVSLHNSLVRTPLQTSEKQLSIFCSNSKSANLQMK